MSMPIASPNFSSPSIAKCIDEDEEKSNMDLIFDRYKDRVAKLPKEKGLPENVNVYMYEGFWYASRFRISVETIMALQNTFKAHPTDIYLATLPKSGTTWLKALVFALVNRNRYKNNCLTHPLLVSSPHICLPYIEFELFKNTPTYVDEHLTRIFATHIAYTSLPKSIIDSRCRLIYLCRNPKDVLVSYFHFVNKIRDKSSDLMTLEKTFELFSKGVMLNGPYWDHVKGYYKFSLENPENVLFLTYEDLTTDTANNVKRLAKFMGCPFTKEEEAEGAVQEIVKLCSFENLREVNKHGDLLEQVPNEVFFREGKVGGWVNHLSEEMSRILDEITEEKFRGLNISF